MAYRAIEKVTYQDASGRTAVLQPGATTEDAMLALHAPESFEDTELENTAAPGTSPAEQLGLDAQGGIPEQGKMNAELLGGDAAVHTTGVFASSRLGDPAKAEVATTGGAQVGSPEDAKDVARFAEAQTKADADAAKRREDASADALAAAPQPAGAPVDPTAKPTARSGSRAGSA